MQDTILIVSSFKFKSSKYKEYFLNNFSFFTLQTTKSIGKNKFTYFSCNITSFYFLYDSTQDYIINRI